MGKKEKGKKGTGSVGIQKVFFGTVADVELCFGFLLETVLITKVTRKAKIISPELQEGTDSEKKSHSARVT